MLPCRMLKIIPGRERPNVDTNSGNIYPKFILPMIRCVFRSWTEGSGLLTVFNKNFELGGWNWSSGNIPEGVYDVYPTYTTNGRAYR